MVLQLVVFLLNVVLCVHNSGFFAEEVEKSKGCSPVQVVALSSGWNRSTTTRFGTQLDTTYTGRTSQQGHQTSTSDTSPAQSSNGVFRATAVEMRTMQTASESQTAILPQLRILVGRSLRWLLSIPTSAPAVPERRSRLDMELLDRSHKQSANTEKEEPVCQEAGKGLRKGQRERRKGQGERQGKGQGQQRASSLSLPGQQPAHTFDHCHSIPIHAKHCHAGHANGGDYGEFLTGHRPHCCYQEGIPRRLHDSFRNQRSSRQVGSRGNEGLAPCHNGTRQGTEIGARTGRSQRSAQNSVACPHEGVTGELAAANASLRRAAVQLHDCHHQGSYRDGPGPPVHPSPERQSCGENTPRTPTCQGRRARSAGKGRRSGGERSPKTSSSNGCPLRNTGERKDACTREASSKCRSLPRERRREGWPKGEGWKRKKTSIHIAIHLACAYGHYWHGTSGTRASTTGFYRNVTTGSALLRLRSTERVPTRSRNVRFDVVEAYHIFDYDDDAACLAQPYHCLFNQTTARPLDEYSVNPFEAALYAIELRSNVIDDSSADDLSLEAKAYLPDCPFSGLSRVDDNSHCDTPVEAQCSNDRNSEPDYEPGGTLDPSEGPDGIEWQGQFMHADEDQNPPSHSRATLKSDPASRSGHIGQSGHEQTNKQSPTFTNGQPGWNERPLAFSFAGADDVDLLLHRMLVGEATLTIHSFGYKDRDLGKRTLLVTVQELHEWRRLLREQWSDHYTMPPFLIFPIRPPPVATVNTISVIVQLGEHAEGEALALTQIVTDVMPTPDPTVVRLPHMSSKQKVCEAVGVHSRLQSSSIVKQGFVVWLTGFPRQVRDGDFLRILVDEELETTSLTQIGKPASVSTTLCRPPTKTMRLLDEVRTRAQERTRESQGIGQAPVQRQLPPHQGGANRLFPWHLWEQLFNERAETEDVQANLALYGLAIEPLGTRYGWIRELSRPSILRMARLLFPEMTEWDMTLHLVTPQPQDPLEQVHILVEFLQENTQLGNMVPVLVDVRWFEASQLRREHRAAAYIATPTNKMALLDDLANSCQPEGEMICSVWTRGSPCLDFMTATLHRGDLVSIRILPQWTDEISYGVSFSNGPAFYRFASIVTHQGSTRMINVVIHTPSGGVTTHQLNGFDTNTMRIIGTHADAVWGQQTVITFFEAPSGMRDGWHFGVSNLQSDATPLLIELVHQTDQGPLRQFSLALLLSGMSISQCIAYNTENHWHGVDFQRVILFNHRPIDEEQLYTTEAPPPGTLVTISIGDPGGPILPHGEPLPEVSSESDESIFGQYAMSYGERPEVKTIQVSGSEQREGQDDEDGASLLQLSRPLDTEPSKEESNGTAYIICNHILDSDATAVLSPRDRTALPVPVVTARPNQDLQVAMDDDIPYFHRDSQGHVYRGRIIPPPGWEVNPLFRSAWTTGAAFRNVQGALTIRIRSWCIKHGSPPERVFRDFSMRPQLLVHLQEAIRRIWRDKISTQDQTLMHQVRPTPMADADGARPMHFIIEVSRPQQCELQPVLMAFRQISPQGVSNDVSWVPALLPHPLTSADVLRSGQVPCELHQLLVPLAGRVRRWMNPYHQRETTPGLFLPVWWDLRLRPLLPQPYHPDPTLDDDIEALNLMQTRAASRSPRRTPSSLGTLEGGMMVHIFHMSNEHRLVGLDRTKPLTFIEQIEEIWVLPRHNRITELHQVSHPPGDLEATADTTFILETTANRNRQALPTDQLILFDLQITETGKPDPEMTIRKVLWARSRMTRSSFLHLVAAHSVCHATENDCELWINNVLWNEDGGAPRQVLHGDFLCLRIAGSPSTQATDIQLALSEQESADAQRFIFRPSPTPSPQGSPVALEKSESEKDFVEDEVTGSGIHLTEMVTIEDENLNVFADPNEGRMNPAGQVSTHLPLQNITNLLEPSIGAKSTDGTPFQPLSPRPYLKPNRQVHGSSGRMGSAAGCALHPIPDRDAHAPARRSFNKDGTANNPMDPSDKDSSESKPHVLDRWCAQSLECPAGMEQMNTPTTVKLQSLIEPPCWVRIDYQQIQTLRDQLLGFQAGQADQCTAKVVKWHDATLDALAKTPKWTDEPVLSYQLYTDGSSYRQTTQDNQKERIGASAVVLIVNTPAGERYGGSMTFRLQDEPTAPQTEIAAITIALLWIKTLAQWHPHYSHQFHATIGFDCMTAGKAAAGHWKINANRDPQTVNRALTQWLQQQYGQSAVNWTHISSHQGHAWNEAADALAWAAVHQWIDASDFHPVQELLYPPDEEYNAASWLWFLEASLQGSPQVPPHDGTHFLVNIAAPLASKATLEIQPLAVRRQQDAYQGPRQDFAFTLRCATANVLTLFSKEDSKGAYISARQEALIKQMNDQKVHIVGVQETRSAADGHACAEGYHILSAPASSKGVGGVQVWVAQTWVFDHFRIDITTQHLRILHSTTQRMVVALDHPGLKLLLVTAHAPACENNDFTRKFWTATSVAVPKSYQNWPTIHLLDANARTGSIVSASINSHGGEEENDAGAEFHEWLHRNCYVVPQSFRSHHVGPSDTWVHPRGTRARIDYIAIDQCLLHDDVRTWVSEEVDLSLQRTDHLCVMMDLPLSFLRCESSHAPRKAHAVETPLEDDCHIPWHINVHDHAARLQNYMQQQQHDRTSPVRRKQHLQEETWWLIGWKKFHWKRLRQVRRTATFHLLRNAFAAWSHRSVTLPSSGWKKLCDTTLAWHLHQYDRYAALAQKRVRQDDKEYYKNLMESATQANADEGLTGLWRTVKGLLPKNRKKASSNIRCRGPAPGEIRDHFNALEAGEAIEYGQLLRVCQERQYQGRSEAPLTIPLSQIPTRIDLEQQVLRQHVKKAPGLDRVQGTTLRQALHDHPVPFYTLLFKTWATAAEPLQYKGGLIHCISKKASGHAGHAKAKDMRGIMLLDGMGKSYHALVRAHLMTWSSPRRLPLQFGGYRGQQTLFGTQFLRSFSRVAQKAGVSTSLLFLDVRSAFHSMIREQTFGGSLQLAPRLQQMLGTEGFEIEKLENDIPKYSQEFVTTAPLNLQRLLQDAHASTWFTLAHHDGCYQTHRGSRPGSPLADLAYNTMMQSVLHEVTHVLSTDPDHVMAGTHLGLQVGPIAWVDDVAIPIMTMAAEHLEPVTIRILTKVEQIFQAHGLRLNYSSGKTEAVMQYRGTGAPALRKERFVNNLGHPPLPQGALRTVSEYQYLGTSFSQAVSLEHEIHQRLTKATNAYRMLRRHLFSNKRIPARTRLLLLDSLVTSILLHGAGNWPLLSARVYHKLNHALMKWYRTITGQGFWNEDTVPDAELLAIWDIPPLSVRLCKLRLLYAFQWYQNGPSVLHDIVTAEDFNDKSWFAAVRRGIKWLGSMCELETDCPDTTEYTLQWIHDHVKNGGVKQVRRAMTRYLLQQHVIFDVYNGHKRIRNTLQSYGATFPTTSSIVAAGGLYKCLHCDKTFDSAQALQGHVWSWHRICSDERLFVYSDTCQACGVCFWTSQRVQQHLKASRGDPHGCLAFLMEYFDPLEVPASVSKPHELQRFHRLPCTMTFGPHDRPIEHTWRRRQLQRLAQCDAQWQALNYPTSVDQDAMDRYSMCLTTATNQWHVNATHDVDTLEDSWHHIFAEHADEKFAILAFLYWGQYHMYDVTSAWDDPDDIEAVDRLFQNTATHFPIWTVWSDRNALLNLQPPLQAHLQADPAPVKVAAPRVEREPIPDHLQEQNELLQPLTGAWADTRINAKGVPLLRDDQGRCYLLILHMFSGRRRDEDCCHWAKELKRQYFNDQDFEVLMLSVDTAVDPVCGNLDQGPMLDAMGSLAASGAVAMGMSGPPCETWSAARHLNLEAEGEHRGPRPLRSRSFLWGLRHRMLRELKQMGTGNRLMLNAIWIEVNIAANGGVTLMEHPDEPWQEDRASVWRTALQTTMLPSTLQVAWHHLQQWRYGGVAVKPTMIRTMGMKCSYDEFRKHEIPTATRPRTHLGGRDATTGAFKTASAKEYPPSFCKALVAVTYKNLSHKLRQEGANVVPISSLDNRARAWMYRMLESGSQVNQDAQWLRDYQPS